MKYLTKTALLRNLHPQMARKCIKTGAKTSSGQARSKSLRSTKRTFRPNIQKTRIFDPETGEYKKVKVAASYIRTLAKRLQQGKKV